MLRAEPSSWFSWNYDVRDGGQAVCTLSNRFGRSAGSFDLAGSRFAIHREPRWGDFVLTGATGEIARAKKTSMVTFHFRVSVNGAAYDFDADSMFSRNFPLRHEGSRGGRELGAVRSERFFSRTALAELPETIPPDLQIFLIWLVLLIWRRQSDG